MSRPPINTATIPPELAGVPQWATHRDKEPLVAWGSRRASSTDPKTWRSLEQAVSFVEAGHADGIYFALKEGSGIVGIDLDHCRDPETGVLAPWAMLYVRMLHSYTVVSYSGTGLRIFVKGKLPPTGRKRGPVECYEWGRFLSITDARIDGTPATIEERQLELEAFHRLAFGEPRAAETANTMKAVSAVAVDPDDERLLERGRLTLGPVFGRLLDGDFSDYDDDKSDAESGLIRDLLRLTGLDADRTERIIRSRAELRRDKWDDNRVGKSYLRYSIDRLKDQGVAAPCELVSRADRFTPAGSDGAEGCLRCRQVEDVLANPGVDPGAKVVAIAAVMELERRDGWKPSELERDIGVPEGFTIVANERLAKRAGLDKRTVGRHLRTLVGWGVLRQKSIGRQVTRVDPSTGEITTSPRRHSALALVGTGGETLARVATLTLENRTRKAGPGRGHTGCPDHPLAGTYERTRTSVHCEVCHRTLQSKQVVSTGPTAAPDSAVDSTQKQVVFTEPTRLQAERLRRRLHAADVDGLADRENAADLRATLEALYARAAPPEDEWCPLNPDELIWWARMNGVGP